MSDSKNDPSQLSSQTAHEQKQAVQLSLLNSLSTKLQSLMDDENFYQEVVNLIREKLNYYSIQFWSGGPDGSATLQAQSGAYGTHLKIGHTLLNHSAGITGYVIRKKKSYLSNNVEGDPLFTNLSLPVQTMSQLCIPIIKDGEAIATLNVESDQTDAFDTEDIITMESVASQVAVAITNRNLYSRQKAFNETLRKAVDEKTHALRQAHARILEQQKLLKKENKALKTLVNKENESMEIVGKSPAISNILTMVDKIAPTLATVLIQGESGTGKELIARRLHFRSDRAEKPYVTVNCGALQETLLESELFGHEKGAFTGAHAQKIGLVETADGGTLFLDEIGEMALSIQAKLLRFLQENEFYRIGGKRPLKVNVRVVSATNRDLEQEVKENRFREDLFYRLNTITLRMPPLRKRPEDIPALVEFFLRNSRFGVSTQNITKVDPKLFEALQNYSWPGNIRELQNTIERMKILSDGPELKLEDVPFSIRMPKATKESGEFNVNLSLQEVEKNHILRALSFNHGNKTKTAQKLGITIKTLYNKLHRYGVINQSGSPEEEHPHVS